MEKAGSRSAEIDYNDRMARLHSVHTPVKILIFTTTPNTPPVEYIVSAKVRHRCEPPSSSPPPYALPPLA